MKKLATALLVTTGAASIIVMLVAVLLLKDETEYFVIRSCGIVLIILLLISNVINKPNNHGTVSQSENGILGTWINIIAAIGIVSSIFMAYFIFFCTDNFPHRKTYLVLTLISVGVALGASHLLSSLIGQRAGARDRDD